MGEINAKFPNDDIISYHQAENDATTLKVIEKFLFLMEEISVGVNAKVFDIRVFGKKTGEDYTKWFDRLEKIIEHLRKKYHYPTLYRSFEKMIHNLEKIRKKERAKA